MDIDFKALAAPFDPKVVSWRVGPTNRDKTKGMALAYIDARDVMERLDSVCGPDMWQDRYEFHGTRTICYLSIRVGGEWITKADGAGDSDMEAEKGAISDALKRAAVKWGIGRYLYDMPTPWVEINSFGKSYVIAPGEHPRLEKLLPGSRVEAPPPADTGAPEEWVRKAIGEMERLATLKALGNWWSANQGHITSLPEDERAKLTEAKDKRKAALALPPPSQPGTPDPEALTGKAA